MIPTHASPGDKKNKSSFVLFWSLAQQQAGLTELERIETIHRGLHSKWLVLVMESFSQTKHTVAELANVSATTFDRRIKANAVLDTVASERLDRLAQTAVLADDVFEDKEIASKWMTTPNDLLGGNTPFSLCETELGARQVRRVLHSIDWGNVA